MKDNDKLVVEHYPKTAIESDEREIASWSTPECHSKQKWLMMGLLLCPETGPTLGHPHLLNDAEKTSEPFFSMVRAVKLATGLRNQTF